MIPADQKRTDPFERLVDSLALVDCHPKEVPQRALLEALLTQSGHYVSDKVVGLLALAGVAPRDGLVLVMRCGSWDRSLAPESPDRAIRSNGEYDVLWYDDDATHPLRPSPLSPDTLRFLGDACARWAEPSTWEPKLHFPWGASAWEPEMKTPGSRAQHWYLETRGEPPPDDIETPAEHHAYLLGVGNSVGLVALAAGRIGEPVLHIGGARWMFDLERESS